MLLQACGNIAQIPAGEHLTLVDRATLKTECVSGCTEASYNQALINDFTPA